MHIFFSVGEPSGDLHGSNLIRRLKSQDPSIECVGFGGPKMAEAGCKLHFELTSLAVMFLAKVLANIRTFFRLIDEANDYFRDHKVDAVVLIDYPGFNWWIAKKAKKHNIPVFYYGVPQVWAWAPWRVRKIRKFVDHVLCKLPFEVEWFGKRKCHGTYVGHPYFDQLSVQEYDQGFIASLAGGTDSVQQRFLTLLPGSRDSEVENNLPILLKAAGIVLDQSENVKVVIACYNEKQKAMAEDLIEKLAQENALEKAQESSRESGSGNIELFVGRTPELIKSATACIACSGSVSMELLYHRKPTVIVYKIKKWVMLAQSIMLRTKFITLVNLIASDDIKKTTWAPFDPDAPDAGSVLMPEYLTTGDPSGKVAAHINRWLSDESIRQDKVGQLERLAQEIAKPGASRLAADFILEELSTKIQGSNTNTNELGYESSSHTVDQAA